MLKTLLLILLLAPLASAQTLPAKWEELTAEDFVAAVNRAGGVCVLPFGIIEKHGPAGPLGNGAQRLQDAWDNVSEILRQYRT